MCQARTHTKIDPPGLLLRTVCHSCGCLVAYNSAHAPPRSPFPPSQNARKGYPSLTKAQRRKEAIMK